VIHETVVLVSVRTTDTPQVPQGLRASVHDLGQGFVQVMLQFGFMEDHNVTAALENIVHPDFGFDITDATFFIGKETIIPSDLPGMVMWREHLYSLLHRNASNAAHFFGLPHTQVMEVGVHLEI
jgi:KUP system potassium uptake protein